MAAKAAALATVALLVTSNFLSLAGFAGAAASADEGASSLAQQHVATSKILGRCPHHALKMAVCFRLLGGLIGGLIGQLPEQPTECCSLIGGMVDFETATCLCTAIKLHIIGMNLNLPIAFSLLNNYCGTKPPTDFQCF